MAAKIVTNVRTWKHFSKLSSAVFGWAFNTNLFLRIVVVSCELIESQGQKKSWRPSNPTPAHDRPYTILPGQMYQL